LRVNSDFGDLVEIVHRRNVHARERPKMALVRLAPRPVWRTADYEEKAVTAGFAGHRVRYQHSSRIAPYSAKHA
jgi:hypothetical protein